ncbi:glycosyltransferase [Falsiroseomonas sp.]|uniref:glycosyltransferase family 4 protein n=1 Tax=Falsiroseomonas sp. TaxID=2870721 RepID=UPI003F720D7F
MDADPSDAPLPPSPEAIRARGDALRDARDWAGAEAAYREYLAERPRHWQIHVQLGHTRKEQGDPEGALPHYRHAAMLAPDDPDPVLQAGHVLRNLGRGREAAEALARALALAPGSADLRHIVALLRHRTEPPPEDPYQAPPPRPTGPPTQLAFDVTDLLDYLRAARTPTGIQRVQMGILGALLASPQRPANVILVAFDGGTWRWWHVEEAGFRRVLALARIGGRDDDPAWRAATAALVAPDARPDAPIVAGCTLCSLGNAWGVQEYFRGLRRLRATTPIRYVAFVHDCVPLAMPEHCLDLTVRLYARWFAALSLHADGILANSRATIADHARFAAPLGPVAPAGLIRLAAEAGASPVAAAQAAEALRTPRPGEDFVLFVATLESRKNHLMVFQAWLSLIRRLGADRVPRLVCVGRPGWRAEAALALLEGSPDLRRKVTVQSGVSDLALAGLYGRCLFTVYNSFHEGWGLPVSESLAAGKLAVIPAHSGLLEAGAPGAVFFAPQDEPDLVAKLEMMLTDPAQRAALESRIDRGAARRDWPDAAREVLEALADPADPPDLPQLLPLGRHLPMGWRGDGLPSRAMAWAERVREGLAWWWQEDWGVWMRDGIATLALPMDQPEGTPMRLVLELRAPPRPLALRLRGRGRRAEPWRGLTLQPGETIRCVLQAEAGAGGLAVDFDNGDGVPLGDRFHRVVGAGLIRLMLCREDDLAARLGALERAEG